MTRHGSWHVVCIAQVMKRALALSLLLLVIVSASAIGAHANPVIIYNPSNSVPSGFYVRATELLRPGMYVTVQAVRVAPEYAAARDYADPTDRFLKRVAAMPGQVVCAEGDVISIDGVEAASREERDSMGRTLPSWRGCRTLAADEVFLLGDTHDSFDGRYWGPISTDLITGIWTPL